jgi:hypothetical protein
VLKRVDTLEDRVNLEYQGVITGINQIQNAIKDLKSQLDKIGKNTGIPKLNNQIKQSSGFSKTLKGIAGIGTAVVTGRKMIKTLQGMTDESVKFVETANLFSVSMGKGLQGLNQYYERAVKFQNELEEKLGVNIEESMNYQALFNSMSKSMGISAKYAYILSENFTKLGYDLSSLYNIDPENAMQKLRAGLAGQTKPLRDLGLDITQQSLQPIADSLGIERSVKNMSQAEKMVLRYIAVLKQAQIAQGDFANTMESPANQLRIFNAQVVAFKRNMGNLWQGLLGGVLPYVNAIMMVINELLKMIAKLFGFKVSDQKVNLSANIGADDLASDLGTASGKAKELKNQLMGFDEINNITLPSSSGGGSGGISGGGIDQRLLDAMKEYDNLMGKVKNKATDIRDKIMKWLGFTKKINPLTGEISWEYTGMSKQAKTILGILKTICALYIGAKILKLIGWLNTLRKVLLGTKVATTSFQTGLASLGKGFRGVATAGKTLTTNFKYYKALGATTGQAFSEAGKDMLNLIPTTVKVAGGIAGLVGSCGLAYKSMKDLSKGTSNTNEAFLKLSGGIAGATGSGALIGSVFGPAGTAVGAIVGGASAIVTALLGYEKGVKEIKERKALESLFDNQGQSMERVLAYYDKLKGKIESFTTHINNSTTNINENNQKYNETANSIENLATKIKSAYYDINSQDFKTIKEDFTTLAEITNDNTNEIVSSLIGVARHMEELGTTSKQETDKMIDDLVRYQTMQGDKTAELKRQMTELELARQKGGISTEEYSKKVLELTEKMDELNGKVSIHKTKYNQLIDDYNNKKINLENPEKAKEFVEKLKTSMQDTITEMETARTQTLNMVDTMIESTTDPELISSLEAYKKKVNESFDVDVDKIKGDYKGTFGTIKAQLIESGTETSDKMKEVVNEVNNALKETGNVDLSGEGKNTFDTYVNGLIESKSTSLPKLIVGLQEAGFQIKDGYLQGITFTDVEKDIISNNWTEGSQIKQGDFVRITEKIAEDGATIRNANKEAITFTDEEKKMMSKLLADPYFMDIKDQARILNKIIENGGEIRDKEGKAVEFSQEEKDAISKMLSDPLFISEKDRTNVRTAQEKFTRNLLDTLIQNIYDKTPEASKVAEELTDEVINKFDVSPEARQKATEVVKGYMQGLSEDEQRNILKQCGIANADKVIAGLKQGDLSEDVGINIIKGLRNGLQNNYWQGRTLSTAFSFATNVLNRFKNTFGIHSPSRKTNKFGVQLLEGLGLGVKKESRNVLNTVSGFSNKLLNEFDNPIKEFSDGIEVDTKELSVNASEFVDYGSISGNISTKINNNNLGEIIVGAIINGMQKAKVQVDIEAKADEGIIVRKASKGFTEYVEQTGELPFPVPV